MAKKTPVKKSKRRLKRSVRRSLAAVLMITAIGVAAIPVPENYAVDSKARDVAVQAADDLYVEQVGNSIPVDDKGNKQYKDEQETAENPIFSLDIHDGNLYWQCKINGQKVIQYNDNLGYATSVTLKNAPTRYRYVSVAEYTTFSTRSDKYELTYDSRSLSNEARQFYNHYFTTEYQEFLAACNAEDTNAQISYGISDLTEPQKRTFYCIVKNIGEDYTLESVTSLVDDDNANTQVTGDGGPANGSYCFIPRYIGNGVPDDKLHDEDGYYLDDGGSTSSFVVITSVGKYAFAGSILEYVTFSDALTTIGEGAFMGCTNLRTVNIPGLRTIDNGAFKLCSRLQNVNWWNDTGVSGLSSIGTEAFYGSGITETKSGQGVVLPMGVSSIGDAAFYKCGAMKKLVFEEGEDAVSVDIGDYAFYDNVGLESVTFNSRKPVSTLGDYCFAVGLYENALKTFTFPNSSFNTDNDNKEKKYILANRTNLEEIIVPGNVRRLNEDVLVGCSGLKRAEFIGNTTTYAPALFDYVMEPSFYVTGPAVRTTLNPTVDDPSNPSGPRESTWDAKQTGAGQYIPYLYTINGVEYYEICSDGYLLSIDKETGTLTSCKVRDGGGDELVIPSQVGDTPVTQIASGCFTDKAITDQVKRLVIGDNVETIGNDVFNSWSRLAEVEIGKGIRTIGSGAFANCRFLEDVTFATPDSYETLTSIGDNAFAVTAYNLTIHGDIVEGYLPFEYAVNPNNFVGDSTTKYRILYQSRWDSPASKHMSVMYEAFDDANGCVTLVDYPLYQDFYDSDRKANLSEDLQEHNRDMERFYYYDRVYGYGDYSHPSEEDPYLERKVRFAYDFVTANPSYDYKGKNKKYSLAEGEDYNTYGPWVNPKFCNRYKEWLDDKWLSMFNLSLTEEQKDNTDRPVPYFDKYPYNFLKNYLDKDGVRSFEQDYIDGWTLDEEAMMKAAEEIVIPTGVDSIDLWRFCNPDNQPSLSDQTIASNRRNYLWYFGTGLEDNRSDIFLSSDADAPGLFSGYINDMYPSEAEGDSLARAADEDAIDKGAHRKGNDRIKVVDMRQSSITSIPDYAFDDCELLEQVYLPAACDTVGKLPFRGCTKLTTVASDSDDIIENNGILYKKLADGSYRLIECLLTRGVGSGEDEWTVSAANDDPYISQVSTIDDSAFENCQGILYVDLSCIDNGASSNKLNIIPTGCFRNCDALLEVNLPNAVHTIAEKAFADIREEQYHGAIGKGASRLHVTIKGSEVSIAPTAFDPKREVGDGGALLSTIDIVTLHSYMDSAPYHFWQQQHDVEGYDIRFVEVGVNKRVNFWDWNGDVLYDGLLLDEGATFILERQIPQEVTDIVNEPNHRPGYNFREWIANGGVGIGDEIPGDSITYVAQYDSDGSMVNGKYVVEFIDGIDGHQLTDNYVANPKDGKYYVDAGKSFADMEPGWRAPNYEEHEGYKFLAWSHNWTENTIIDSNMTIVALYSVDTSGGTTSGGSTTTSGSSGSTTTSGSSGSTTTSGSSGSTTTSGSSGSTSNTSNTSNTSSSGSSSSDSTSSTTSGSDSTAGKYTVTVINGSGSGTYDAGSTVIIAANTPAAGMQFLKWTTESNGVALASVSLPATTFTMPANNVTVTAEYTVASAAPAGTSGSGSIRNPGDTNNGSTRVDITKPGISNKDLASANVNGSTDNFIVRISETDEATRAVQEALINKYGSLDNLLYYAMDISLYDSTGTVKITNTAGLSVDITIPIPDALVAFGGNNMAGAVINGNQLENLNESFTTINGVPCIRFTATHFSPYTIYVDTGNLTEGMLDVTPKTGDPIHPKWFLSIGLACMSVILFMKKDKAVKVKKA